MSNLSVRRKKERFLKTVESVDKDTIVSLMQSIPAGEDIYTHIVTTDAFNTGFVDDKKINDFVLRYYSDWYFLAKNTGYKNTGAVKIFGEYEFSPVSMINDKCLELIKGGKYRDILPIFVQYVNKLEDRYFLCINMDKLYCRGEDKEYPVRLYINLPSDKSIDFAHEFIDRVYNIDVAGIFKILNNDSRFDTITIYTDYQSVDSIVELVDTIKSENPSIFDRVGKYSPLLGVINDTIGFGEQLGKDTYLSTRCQAFRSLKELASVDTLKGLILGQERAIIGNKNSGQMFTPTQYLQYLIAKNARTLAEDAIARIESTGEEDSDRLEVLYTIREDGRDGYDMVGEVNKLKSCITTFKPYSLQLDNCLSDNYDYIDKLFRLFSSDKDRLLSTPNDVKKKNIIGRILFPMTEQLIDASTEQFLYDYFKTELAEAINNVIADKMNSATRCDNEILSNLRKKSCDNLRRILLSVIDDGEEGRAYIYNCLYDYLRILSTDSPDRVSISIAGRTINIDKDVHTDIISLLPDLQESINNLTHNSEFIDNKLEYFGINPNNLCLAIKTKDLHKEKLKESVDTQEHYYYNPEGYLSQDLSQSAQM